MSAISAFQHYAAATAVAGLISLMACGTIPACAGRERAVTQRGDGHFSAGGQHDGARRPHDPGVQPHAPGAWASRTAARRARQRRSVTLQRRLAALRYFDVGHGRRRVRAW